MSEKDYVVPGIVTEKKGVVEIREVYRVLKKWLEKRGYVIIEKKYSDEIREEKSISIGWEAEKEVDDYTRFVIKVSLKGKGEEVKLKKKDAFKGVVSVKFESWLEQDYEERWEASPIFKFFRGMFDKYALSKRFNRYAEELKEDTYDIYQEIKSFLGLWNVGK